MKRHEFLKSIGITGPALMAVMASCLSKEDMTIDALVYDPNKRLPDQKGNSTTVSPSELIAIKNPLLKLNLKDVANVNLTKVGGYIRKNGIVVALVGSNSFAAVTQLCTHEPRNEVTYNGKEFYCTVHGARFTLEGKGLNSEGSRGIKVYNVATDGDFVVVY